jgi:hypothetical protein
VRRFARAALERCPLHSIQVESPSCLISAPRAQSASRSRLHLRLPVAIGDSRIRVAVAPVIEMPRNTYVAAYLLVLIAVVVGVDFLFFRNRFWERLMANIGIVLLFAAFYMRFLRHP